MRNVILLSKLNANLKTLSPLTYAEIDKSNSSQLVFATQNRFYSADIGTGSVKLIIGSDHKGYSESTRKAAHFGDIQSFIQVQVKGHWRLIVTDSSNGVIRWVFRHNQSSARIVGRGKYLCEPDSYPDPTICSPKSLVLEHHDKTNNRIKLFISQPTRQHLLRLVIGRSGVRLA